MTIRDLFGNTGFRRLLVLFLLVNVAIVLLKPNLEGWQVDGTVLIWGNLILFIASSLALLMYGRAHHSTTPHGFTRQVYAAFVVKFFLLVTAIMVYFYFARAINTKAIFVCMGLYLLYHFLGSTHAAKTEKRHSKKAVPQKLG